MQNEFEDKRKEFIDRKYELKKNCNEAIDNLSKEYLDEAEKAGYVFDKEKSDFVLNSEYVIDYQICSFGRIDKKPEYKLVHNIENFSENQFMEYAEYLGSMKVKGLSYNSLTRAKILAQIFADDIIPFHQILKGLSKTDNIRGASLILEQGLTTRSFVACYPSDDKAWCYYNSIKILNYYGGFTIRLKDLQATFHLYQISNDSKSAIDDYLKLEAKGKIKSTETFFGIQNVIYC